jgi:hypothetical protein
MKGSAVSRPAALSGAGFFVLATVGHFAYPSGPDFMAAPRAAQAFYVAHHGAVLAANTLYLLSGMLLLVFAAALRGALRGDARGDLVATAVFGGLVAGASLMIASSGVDMAAALHVQEQGTIAPSAASVLWDLNHVLFGLAAPMALAVALLGCALASLRDRALPAWLGAISLALGVALAIPPINYVSIVVFIFWSLATSIVLALPGEAAASVLPRASAAKPLATVLAVACVGGVAWAAAASPAQAATLPKLTLNVGSSSVAVGGATQSGAVEVAVDTDLHKGASAMLFRLDPGRTAAELATLLKSKKAEDPNYASRYGAIVLSAEVVPGHPSEAQTELEPGEYVALATPGRGAPKFATPFTVSAAIAPAALPKPQATIRLVDFDFRGPGTLRDGELVRFENDGFLVHMDIALPVKGKAAANRVARAMLNGDEKSLGKLLTGPPLGLQGVISPGGFQQERIEARPGWYVQACFMEDQEGVPHTRLGMVRPLRIVR